MSQEIQLTKINDHIDCAIGDIIFIHGLGGNGEETWTTKTSVLEDGKAKDLPSYFPLLLAKDFPKTNIWALDYSAKSSNWEDSSNFNELPRLCIEIHEYLIGKGIGNRPLIFISHSLGGIVVKQLMKLSFESKNIRHQKLYKEMKAVSFIATPHAGSKWADIISNINSVLKVFRTSDRIEELKFDNPYLEQLAKWHKENVDHKKIETQAFYEAKKTKTIMVVEKQSANPHVIGCDPIRINENHLDICKPTNRECLLYVSVYGLIQYHFYNDDVNNLDTTKENQKKPLRLENIVIGIVKNNDQVLMVKRRDNVDNLTWQFVAGRLKYRENEETCVIREISEETNIKAKIIKKLGINEGGDINVIRHYYACEYLDGTPRNGDQFENEEVAWVSINKVRKFVTTPISKEVSDYLEI